MQIIKIQFKLKYQCCDNVAHRTFFRNGHAFREKILREDDSYLLY